LLEDEELENFSSVFSVETNLQSTNSVFDNFFGSLFTFIVTPSRFSAVGHFSGVNALNEKRVVLKNQLSALRQGIITNSQLISNEKNKLKELRDKAFKLRAEITLISSKIEKGRNLQFMLNKSSDVIQDAIDEKNRIIDHAKSVVQAKESENEKRRSIIAETREKLQKLQKENELKKSEIDNLRNNQEILQTKIINAAILYENATDEWNSLAKEINERIGKSNQVQTELGDLDKKLRSLYRVRRENLKEKESLDLQISTYAEFIKVKQGEERPILNEKKLTLQIIDDIEASMTRQHRECKILIKEKIATEEDTRKLEYNLDDLRDRIEINKLTIKSKEEMIELNQPLIPNITCNTRFY
jgi:chromosome segregation ATPase